MEHYGSFELLYQRHELPTHIVQRANLLINDIETFPADRDNPAQFVWFPPKWLRDRRNHPMQIHQLLDFCKGEAKLLIALDENHPFEIVFVKTSVSAFIPQRCWQQALPFVKTNRLDVHSRPARQIADVHVSFSTLYLGTMQARKRWQRGSTI
jgi:hypothetical protein